MTDADVFGYQQEVWSRPEVEGYNELVDMDSVTRIDLPSTDRVAALAMKSAIMDSRFYASKFAIVASQDVSFALGRMFRLIGRWIRAAPSRSRCFAPWTKP
jgi:hypothetical protein